MVATLFAACGRDAAPEASTPTALGATSVAETAPAPPTPSASAVLPGAPRSQSPSEGATAAPPLTLRRFSVPPELRDDDAIRCEPAALVPLRRGQAVEMEVVPRAGASRLIVAPAAGTLTRTAAPWPRVGQWTGAPAAARDGPGPTAGPACLGLLRTDQGGGRNAEARDGDAWWHPAELDIAGRPGIDPHLLQLRLPPGWVEAALVGPGGRVVAGTPLLRWVADDGLAARLRLSTVDQRRLGDLADADVVVLEGKRAPWVATARWQPEGDGGWLLVDLPAGNAAPAEASPGDRIAALLRSGSAQPRLAVPRAAVVLRGVERFVWVRHDDRTFGQVQVAVGVDGGDRLEILHGVDAGQCVLVAGQDVIEAAVAALRSGTATTEP